MNTLVTLTVPSTGEVVLEFSYLLSAILFVIGLKLQSHPNSARRGNIWAV